MENRNNQETIVQTGPYDLEMKKFELKQERREKIREFCKKNRYKVTCLSLALVTLILLFVFGFFKTLGIWLVMLIGYGLGSYFDRDTKFILFLKRIVRSLR